MRQPGRGLRGQDLNDWPGLRAATQSSQRIEHRTVGFLASISFDALTVRDVNGSLAKRDLALEFLGQRGLADTRLAGDEDDLSLATDGAQPRLTQHLERTAAAHQELRRPTGHA